MRKVFYTLFIIMCVAIVASCGEGYDAKGQVKKFMKEQMGLGDYDVIAWSNIDSAFHVSDSMLNVMHKKAAQEKLVKGNPDYAKRTDKLNMITVTYSVKNDTLMNTFYLNEKMNGIVGVKNDVFNIER